MQDAKEFIKAAAAGKAVEFDGIIYPKVLRVSMQLLGRYGQMTADLVDPAADNCIVTGPLRRMRIVENEGEKDGNGKDNNIAE